MSSCPTLNVGNSPGYSLPPEIRQADYIAEDGKATLDETPL
jgi:hypothetical protein